MTAPDDKPASAVATYLETVERLGESYGDPRLAFDVVEVLDRAERLRARLRAASDSALSWSTDIAEQPEPDRRAVLSAHTATLDAIGYVEAVESALSDAAPLIDAAARQVVAAKEASDSEFELKQAQRVAAAAATAAEDRRELARLETKRDELLRRASEGQEVADALDLLDQQIDVRRTFVRVSELAVDALDMTAILPILRQVTAGFAATLDRQRAELADLRAARERRRRRRWALRWGLQVLVGAGLFALGQAVDTLPLWLALAGAAGLWTAEALVVDPRLARRFAVRARDELAQDAWRAGLALASLRQLQAELNHHLPDSVDTLQLVPQELLGPGAPPA